MLLTGNYRRNLDDKGRVAMPKQLRDLLGFPEKTNLFITPGTDKSLAIYTSEELEVLGGKLENSSPAAHDIRTFSRLFYSQAQPAEIDRQGRLRIPPELAKFANLSNEVVFLGVRDHIEVWDLSTWNQFLDSSQPRYDELAERALSIAKEIKNG